MADMLDRSQVLLIRADAGIRMGTGHVMRCLALAQAWQDLGGRVTFAIAACPAGIEERLRAEQVEVVRLDVDPASEADACATVDTATVRGSTWVVADGYHFDARYHKTIKKLGLRLLTLDDFGTLEHYWADIVLNQDPIADVRLYDRRESYTRILLGTQYAFVRREFRRQPRHSRQIQAVARRLLVTLGGSDPDNVTEIVIGSLNAVNVDCLETTVLVGPSNPHGRRLEAAAASCRRDIRLLRNPSNIPELMTWCDVAVTAGGSTLWELAYFYVPSIVLLIAENQEPAVGLLHDRGACLRLGSGNLVDPSQLSSAITALCHDRARRAALGAQLGTAADGQGADRVCAAIAGVLHDLPHDLEAPVPTTAIAG
jgi:UDP-2,4-diacetamido-2,4,6-trideoxy-beta-L-altropyranose hydrolase